MTTSTDVAKTNAAFMQKTQTCQQEYASAGKILVDMRGRLWGDMRRRLWGVAEAMGCGGGYGVWRRLWGVAEAMGRQTDLVLDASLPKHKKWNGAWDI